MHTPLMDTSDDIGMKIYILNANWGKSQPYRICDSISLIHTRLNNYEYNYEYSSKQFPSKVYPAIAFSKPCEFMNINHILQMKHV